MKRYVTMPVACVMASSLAMAGNINAPSAHAASTISPPCQILTYTGSVSQPSTIQLECLNGQVLRVSMAGKVRNKTYATSLGSPNNLIAYRVNGSGGAATAIMSYTRVKDGQHFACASSRLLSKVKTATISTCTLMR